jgi:hypothetical protein
LLRIGAALPAGLFGHLFKLARASEVTAVVNHAAVPLIEGTAEAARAGYMPGGSRRNLEWVLPHTDTGGASEEDLLLLAGAQTSGGLLVAGELPGAAVIGELVPRRDSLLIHPLAPQAPRPSRTPLPGRTGSINASRCSPARPDPDGGGRPAGAAGNATEPGRPDRPHLLPRRPRRSCQDHMTRPGLAPIAFAQACRRAQCPREI